MIDQTPPRHPRECGDPDFKSPTDKWVFRLKRLSAGRIPAFAGMTSLLLSSCMVGPDYKAAPAMPIPPNYKEAAAQSGWVPANPNDSSSRGDWWSIYNDPVLDGLEKQVVLNNQNIKKSEAAYREAQAALELARSNLFPTVTANASAQRLSTSNHNGGGNSVVLTGNNTGTTSTTASGGGGSGYFGKGVNSFNVSGDVSWDLDVWGRIRRQIEAQGDEVQATQADLANATLSYQGTLATDYFELRAADQLKRLLDQTVDEYTRAFQIVLNQYNAGIVTKADVAQAQTQIDQTKAQDLNVGITRAQLEHALAVLVGKAPADFTLVAAGDMPAAPVVPPSVPSEILQRRPDVAAAERRTAEANANIGVAIAAFYPDLTLSADYGFTGPVLGRLLDATNRTWSIGPQLAETVFDGGARSAEVREERALFDENTATYRQTVLTAFQQVEDNLASQRILTQQAAVETNAVNEAKQAANLTLNQYKAGIVDFTTVITTQTAFLSNEQSALTVRENQLTASVALIQALGGGWDKGTLPDIKPPTALGSTIKSDLTSSGI